MWSDGPINNFGVCFTSFAVNFKHEYTQTEQTESGYSQEEKYRKILPYDNEVITKPGKKGRFFNNPIT